MGDNSRHGNDAGLRTGTKQQSQNRMHAQFNHEFPSLFNSRDAHSLKMVKTKNSWTSENSYV